MRTLQSKLEKLLAEARERLDKRLREIDDLARSIKTEADNAERELSGLLDDIATLTIDAVEHSQEPQS